MSKKIKLTSRSCSAPVQLTGWNICALCQEHGGGLINPSSKGCESLAKNLSALHELNKLLSNINIRRLDDGDGLGKTLAADTAKWHTACYVMCKATKEKRAIRLRDKAIQETPDSPVKKHLRSASTSARAMSVDQKHLPTSFFCDETTGEMHRAGTMHIDASIRKTAITMKGTSKLSAGDMIAINAVYHKKCLTSFL